MLALTLALITAAPPRKCVPLPPPGQWFHLSQHHAPTPAALEANPVPIRRPLVMSVPGGLLLLTPLLGGRYDLCSDSWKATGPLLERATDYGLPPPVVSERELFFVGMGSTREPFGFFARFDLTTNRWKPFPTKGAPSPRFEPLQAWAGGRFLVFLGRDGFGGSARSLDDGAAFDPTSNTWSPMARPEHTVGFEAAVSLGEQLFIWPHGFVFEVRTNTWAKGSTVGMGRPYQPRLAPVPGGLVAVGGMWTEGEATRYELATDSWRKSPRLSLDKPMAKAHHVVNGIPMLVGNAAPSEGTWAGEGGTLYSASHCEASGSTLYWLNLEEWKSTTQAACWLTLVTPEAVFLLRWPSAEGKDGEARAFNPATGRWRRAVVPAKAGPGSWGEVRWDGRAFWQWGARTTVGLPGDPQAVAQSVDEGWRLEPVWEPMD